MRQSGIIKFEITNALDWLMMPRSNGLNLYTNIFSVLITWQLFKIASEINMEKPFFGNVVKRLHYLQRLIITGWVVTGLIGAYVHYAIRQLTAKTYTVGAFYDIISPEYLTWGTRLVVLLFSYVYKRGVLLQKEQDLTV